MRRAPLHGATSSGHCLFAANVSLLLLLSALALTPVTTATTTQPLVPAGVTIARDMVVRVTSPGIPVPIVLSGISGDGLSLQYKLVSTPSDGGGSLFKPSSVFCKYRYEQSMLGDAISSGNVTLPCTSVQLLYVWPSSRRLPVRRLDVFDYAVSDDDGVSFPYQGRVIVVNGQQTSDVLETSTFDLTDESWTVVDEQTSPTGRSPTFDRTRLGSSLSRFIYATDLDRGAWYFVAPSAFLGHKAMAYGGVISFTMYAPAGDFSSSNTASGNPYAVLLECSTCDSGRGITLGYPRNKVVWDSTSTAKVAIPLSETASWEADPHNSVLPWTAISKCDMVQLLFNLSGFKILGDYTLGIESVALDNVSMTAGVGDHNSCTQLRPRSSL